MPKVRLYETQVSNRPVDPGFQNVRPSADALGGAMGQALQQVGRTVSAIGGEVAQEAFRARDEAEQLVEDFQRLQVEKVIGEQAHGSGRDGLLGFLNKRGDSALDDTSHVKAIRDAKQNALKALKSERSRKRFEAWADGRLQDVQTRFNSHMATQFREAQSSAAAGLMAAAEQEALSSFTDPDAVLGALDRVRFDGQDEQGNMRPGILRRSLQGMAPAEIEAKERAYEQKVLLAGFQKLLEAEDGVAAEALIKHPGIRERLGAAVKDVETRLAPVLMKQQVVAHTDLIIESSYRDDEGNPSPWVNEKLAREGLEKFEDPKAREMAARRLEDLLRDAREEKKQAIAGQYARGLGAYLRSKRRSDIPVDVETFLKSEKNDPDAWVRLERIIEADEEKERVRRGAQYRPPTQEERGEFVRFMLSAAQQPGRYASMDAQTVIEDVLAPLAPRDHDKALAEVKRIQERMRKGQPLGDAPTAELLRVGREQGHFGDDANMKKWTDDERLKYAVAVEHVSEKAGLYRLTNEGKEPPLPEIQKWIGEALIKKEIDGSGWFYDDRRALVEDLAEGKTLSESGDVVGDAGQPQARQQGPIDLAQPASAFDRAQANRPMRTHRVREPNGKVRTINADELDAAIAAGGRLVINR